ncbi:hypothetical protein JCM11641_007845 [Rhodosporidiobolus odoratus]
MQSGVPGLSKRAEAQLEKSGSSPLMNVLFKTFSNQWDEEYNPDGVINAGLAENSLLHPWLTDFFEKKGSLKLEHTDLTYGTSILGSERIFAALASLYAKHFNPHAPLQSSHIAVSNGLSSMIEHLAACISDEGDSWLIPAPWYNGFLQDLSATSKVEIASVDVPDGEQGELGEVGALEEEMQRREKEGGSKITAILVTNPHNPLGFCYKRDVLLEYARFAERWKLYLVVDEIYALSVFASPDDSALPTFTSILSIDVLTEAGCNPSRIIQLYGLSKDFGANGLRGGNLVCQYNERIMQALSSTAMPMRIGSPTDILWSALLNSPDFPTYLSLNRRALSNAYAYLTSWLKAHNIPYRPANAGHFVLADLRHFVRKVGKVEQTESGQEGEPTRDQEIAFLNKLVEEAKVYWAPGFSYAVSQYGFFRVTFSIHRREQEVALARVEKLCDLKAKALELSKQFPP